MSIIYNGQTVAGVYAEQILNNADTINAGIIKIATQEEVDAGENNTSAVTPLYLSNKQDKLESGDNISIENDIISCDIKPDVSTIIQNEDGTLTNVGQLTKSGTIKIDWEGTEAEYTRAMLNGEIDPNWYCYITDDESLVDYADVANQSLSNLRPDGEARFDAKLDKNQITNCLLEVPQNIKLELADGVLTLKAGSKVIVPNGVGVFNKLTISNDLTLGTIGTATISSKLYVKADGSALVQWVNEASGATVPASGTPFGFYNTADNTCKLYNADGTVAHTVSLPIANVHRTSGSWDKIEQVFNGIGFIGNTVWADKGIKVLIPNGRNEDGSLNNIESTLAKVCITTSLNAITSGKLVLTTSSISSGSAYCVDANTYTYSEEEPTTVRWYKPSTNMFYIKRDGVWYKDKQVHIGDFSKTTTSFTSFQPKLPFRAVDYNDLEAEIKETKTELTNKVNKSGDTMTGNLIIEGSQKSFATRSTDLDYTTRPSTAIISAFRNIDKNNKILGDVRFERTTDGVQWTRILARNCMTGSEVTANMGVAVGADGKGYTYAPTPATGDNSTKIATTAFCKNMATTTKATTTSSASVTRPAWIVQNYVNGTSWYRVWSDGWIEQGGSPNYGGNTSTTVTFLKAFSNTNYTITVAHARGSGWTNGANANFYDKTAKTVAIYQCDGTGVSWYACGY